MKTKEFDVILEKDDDGGYVVDVPALPGCHTQGETKEEALDNAKEAIELYLEVLEEKKQKAKLPLISVERVAIHA